MRRLGTKYNNKVRSMLSKTIRGRGRLFFRRVIGFGFILENIVLPNKGSQNSILEGMDLSKFLKE